jgi:hypothetical protein
VDERTEHKKNSDDTEGHPGIEGRTRRKAVAGGALWYHTWAVAAASSQRAATMTNRSSVASLVPGD